MNEEHTTFHYSIKDGWKEIASPFQTDAHGTLKIEGYFAFPQFAIGQEEMLFRAEWWRPSSPGMEYPFFILVTDHNSDWHVFASDFPSAIDVFHKLATIAQAALLHGVAEDLDATLSAEHSKSEKHRRKLGES